MTAFDYLADGNFFEAFMQAYRDIGLTDGMVYGIIFMFAATSLYLKTRNVELVALMAMFAAPLVLADTFATVPLVGRYLIAIIIVGFAYMIYYLLRSKR